MNWASFDEWPIKPSKQLSNEKQPSNPNSVEKEVPKYDFEAMLEIALENEDSVKPPKPK